MVYSPVLISVYNRFLHLQKCIESLKKNEIASKTELFVVSDAASNNSDEHIIEQIREYIIEIKGFKKVHLIANKYNKGSVNSIADARNNVFKNFDRIIFMEDDIEVGPYFLNYMNSCLAKYATHENVFAVSGYNHRIRIPENYKYDVFFLPACPAWGVAYWRDKYLKYDKDVTERFQEFINENKNQLEAFKKFSYQTYRLLNRNIHGEIISGDTRRTFYEYVNGLLTVIPVKSITKSNGNDGSGEHCPYDYRIHTQKVDSENRIFKLPETPFIDTDIYKLWSRYFSNFQKKKRVLIRYFYYVTLGKKIFYRDLRNKFSHKKSN